MSRATPQVEFVVELPKTKHSNKKAFGWVAYVCAKLEAQPGQWARVTFSWETRPANTHNVKAAAALFGLKVDARIRNGELYMRLRAGAPA